MGIIRQMALNWWLKGVCNLRWGSVTTVVVARRIYYEGIFAGGLLWFNGSLLCS